jgi:hypothetical protein
MMFARRYLLGMTLAANLGSATAFAQPPSIEAKDFDRLHRLITPAPDESRWRQMAWQTSIWEARIKAAAEGKPIFLWSGGGAPPLGGC